MTSLPSHSGRLVLNPQLKYLLRRSRFFRRLLTPILVARHYKAYYGQSLPRNAPRTLSEIINWAKAWGDLERFAPFADKYQVRDYIRSIAGEKHVVPLLATADCSANLDWDALPSAFVLKVNHGSEWNIIVREKASADRAAICARLDFWLSQSFFLHCLESQYAPIKPRILAEPYLGDPDKTPADYKINCSLGTPLLIQADYERHGRHTRAILDLDWNLQPARDGDDPVELNPSRPAGLAIMLALARKLSRPFPFVRVDFYEIDGAVYVGELTFTPAGGLFRTTPADYDLVMGRGIDFTAYHRPLEVPPVPRPEHRPWRLNTRLKYLLKHSRPLRRLLLPGLVARRYQEQFGRPLPRKNPRTLLEVINWAKAWGDLENYAPFVDKCRVRDYVRSVAGVRHLPELLAVAGRAADLDWNALPSAFVLKTTHGSGWNVVVRDKNSADRAAISTRLDHWLSLSFFTFGLEAQYAPVKPRIIAEAYLGDPRKTPVDYKILCVHGTPTVILADHDRDHMHLRSFFDLDWNLQAVRDPRFPVKTDCPRPPGLATMLELARKLSRPFPFVRVDFYDIDGAVYVGELTFTPSQGLIGVEPSDFDLLQGLRIDFRAYGNPESVAPTTIV